MFVSENTKTHLGCDTAAHFYNRWITVDRVVLTTVVSRLRSGWKRYSGDARPITADAEG